MSMALQNDSYLLTNFLFHLRTPLYSIKGALQLAQQMPEKSTVTLLDWLEKWRPKVERWISVEEKAHSYFQDVEEQDWKQIVFEMAEDMKDVSIAFAEATSLEVPDSIEGKRFFEMALHGIEYLNILIQPIRNRDYQFLLQ